MFVVFLLFICILAALKGSVTMTAKLAGVKQHLKGRRRTNVLPPHTCEQDLAVFLTRLQDHHTSVQATTATPVELKNLIAFLTTCITVARWKWDGIYPVLGWIGQLYDGENNGSANHILEAMQKTKSCGTIGSVMANVQWASAASLKWTDSFKWQVLETFAHGASWCVESYNGWSVNEVVAILDWTAKNPGKLSDEIIDKLEFFRMASVEAVELAKGLMKKKYSARLGWDEKFNSRVQIALAHTLWNACLEDKIDFEEFMSLLKDVGSTLADPGIAVVFGMSANIVGGLWPVPTLFQLLEWARSNESPLVNIIREAFQLAHDCPKSLEVIIGTYSKSYPESEIWDEAYSNQVLDAVVPSALVCVNRGSYSIADIMNWFETARRNPGQGAFEVADSFRWFPRCDELVHFFTALQTNHEILGGDPKLRAVVFTSVSLGLARCLNEDVNDLAAASTILNWLSNSSPEGQSVWSAIHQLNDCSIYSRIKTFLGRKFPKTNFTTLSSLLTKARDQCSS